MLSLIRHFRLLDVSASILSGILSALLLFLLLVFVVPFFDGGNASIMMRWCASLILGKSVLAPPASFDIVYFLAGFCSCIVMMLTWTLFLTFILHRGGIWVGLFGGALLGFVFYLLFFYRLDSVYPWLASSRSFAMMATYISVSAFAGWIYEILEIEENELCELQ